MALPKVKQDATEARLDALDLPRGGWSSASREAALGRVRAMGLPGRRDEYWKYTRPDTLTQADAPEEAEVVTTPPPHDGDPATDRPRP